MRIRKALIIMKTIILVTLIWFFVTKFFLLLIQPLESRPVILTLFDWISAIFLGILVFFGVDFVRQSFKKIEWESKNVEVDRRQ